MRDSIEKTAGSVIQHGKLSDRIYIMRLNPEKAGETLSEVLELRKRKKYTKIFAKVPEKSKAVFLDRNFTEEARIPGPEVYGGHILFLSKFYSKKREEVSAPDKLEDVLRISLEKQKAGVPDNLPEITVRELTADSAEEAAGLYKRVFRSYPFPISDPIYIKKSMGSGIRYFGIRKDKKLIALSSAEPEAGSESAEMSDFAVLPEERGRSLAILLLRSMHREMKFSGIRFVFTIARSVSYGMNTAFARSGYSYSGRLINNTNIGGALESMNVWWKEL